MKPNETVVRRLHSVKVMYRNLTELAEAISLAAVSVYAIDEALNHHGWWYRGLLLAGVLMSLQAFTLLIRHFNKEVV